MWEGRRRRTWPLTPAPLAQYLGFFPCSGADPGDLLVTSSSCHPFFPSSFATAPGLSCSVPCWVPKNAISMSLLLNSPLWQRCLQRQHLSKTSCGVGWACPCPRAGVVCPQAGGEHVGAPRQLGWARRRPSPSCPVNPLYLQENSCFLSPRVFSRPCPCLGFVCTSPELRVSVPGC